MAPTSSLRRHDAADGDSPRRTGSGGRPAGRRGTRVPPAIARRQWDGAEPPSATVVLLEDRAMPATHVLAPPRPLLPWAADGRPGRESTSRPPSDPGGTQDTAARTSAATFSSTSGVHVTS